jgi:non-specific serine/threonine protein kinase
VVLSLVTAELVREDLPEAAGLLDLGEHRLADLSRPERVFQLAHPELPPSFPALRSLSTRRHNLPVATSSFIGREEEVAAVTDVVRSSRLITLAGIGGVGKTRLALQVAAGLTEVYPDGVFLVDLAPLADPELVAAQVARAIGMAETRAGRDPETLVDALCDHLRERSMLLVLDNCEHLVDVAARICDELLVRCPAVAVLATSREPLAISGEILWRVPPLPVPAADAETTGAGPGGDAVALFCERARGVEAEFVLNRDNAAAVARICRRLDGIPLAMELAAARIGVLTADQVADRLDDTFRLLSVGPRTATARHQTLRATMDWSYELLAPAEQVLMQRLSVFAGSFDLESVEGVAADGTVIAAADVLDLLGRLVAKSLVSVQGQGGAARYRLLETVRQYAAEKLAQEGGEEEARRRHRDHYLGIAGTYVQKDAFTEDRWLIRTDLLSDNFRAALDWSLAHDDADACLLLVDVLAIYWTLGGYFVEGRARLEQALALTTPDAGRPRTRALNGLGFLVAQQGEFDLSTRLHTEALTLARNGADTCEVGVSAFYLGGRILHRGEVGRAGVLLREARESFHSVGSAEGMAWCEMMLGWVAVAGGDRRAAPGHFDAALELSLPTSWNVRAHALGGAALLAAEAGDGDRAESMAAEAVEAARQLGSQTILVMSLTRATEVGILLGGWGWAETRLVELFTVLRHTGARSFLADALELAGLVQEVRGHPSSASRLLRAADRVRAETNETPGPRPVSRLVDAGRQRLAATADNGDPEGVPSRDFATFALRELAIPPRPAPAPVGAAAPVGTPAARSGVLRRTAGGWQVGYGASRFELPDTKGLAYLARLLAEPGREIHVLDLAGSGQAGDAGHAGPVLDQQAKAAYRRRVRELQEDIEEARAWNDPERAGRAELELEALTRELSAAVGLGGRDRMAAAGAERARVSVRKAIATAVTRIGEHDADLGLLLATTVRTGTFCRYTPDPRLPVTWEV